MAGREAEGWEGGTPGGMRPYLSHLTAVVPAHRLQQFRQRLGELLQAHISAQDDWEVEGGPNTNESTHLALHISSLSCSSSCDSGSPSITFCRYRNSAVLALNLFC